MAHTQTRSCICSIVAWTSIAAVLLALWLFGDARRTLSFHAVGYSVQTSAHHSGLNFVVSKGGPPEVGFSSRRSLNHDLAMHRGARVKLALVGFKFAGSSGKTEIDYVLMPFVAFAVPFWFLIGLSLLFLYMKTRRLGRIKNAAGQAFEVKRVSL
jgi:hypothetical protein